MTQWHRPSPETVTYVIGDIHGSIEKFERLITKLDGDIERHMGVASHIVFVGDYIDRGENSADVLQMVFETARGYPEQLTALMGNHEQMLLDFLRDPTGDAKRWLRHGGLETLASFGVGRGLTVETRNAGELLDAAGDLMEAMGRDMVDWMHALPVVWTSGNLWVVHAGADPDIAMPDQSRKTLVWGTRAFLSKDRTDGQWVAFGHQPFDTPFAENGRICTDTGAVYGGELTAARIDPDGDVTFLTS